MLKESIHKTATEKQKKSLKKYRKVAWIFCILFSKSEKKII